MITITNNTERTIIFCCGKKEYVLEPDQDLEIQVEDGDCLYIDEAI